MDPLGDYLKKARKKKKLTLEQVAEQTKIQEHHLQALEDEDFARLPAKVFAKGFVRSYAKALDLDEEETLQCFLQASGTFYDRQQPEQPQPHAQVTLEAAPRQGPDWRLVFGVVLVIVIAAIWYGLPPKEPDTQIVLSEPETSSLKEALQDDPILPIPETQGSNVPDQPVASTSVQPTPSETAAVATPVPKPTPVPPIAQGPALTPEPPPVPTPTPAHRPTPEPALNLEASPIPTPTPIQPVQKPNSPASTVPAPQAPSTIPAENSPARDSHTLEIEATQLTWVVVQSDDQPPSEALLQPGHSNTWKADTQFLLTLGNAAGVAIRLNGQSQGPFGKPGQVVRDIRLRP